MTTPYLAPAFSRTSLTAATNSSQVQASSMAVGNATPALAKRLLFTNSPTAVRSDGMAGMVPSGASCRNFSSMFRDLAMSVRSWSWLTHSGSMPVTRARAGRSLAVAAFLSLVVMSAVGTSTTSMVMPVASLYFAAAAANAPPWLVSPERTS